MKRCGRWEDAHRFADGELAADVVEFEVHLRECGECAALVRDLRALRGIFEAGERELPPPGMKEIIMRLAAAGGANGNVWNGVAAASRRLALAAACLCVVFSALLGLQLRGGAGAGGEALTSAAAVETSYVPDVFSESEIQLLYGDDDQALAGYYGTAGD